MNRARLWNSVDGREVDCVAGLSRDGDVALVELVFLDVGGEVVGDGGGLLRILSHRIVLTILDNDIRKRATRLR